MTDESPAKSTSPYLHKSSDDMLPGTRRMREIQFRPLALMLSRDSPDPRRPACICLLSRSVAPSPKGLTCSSTRWTDCASCPSPASRLLSRSPSCCSARIAVWFGLKTGYPRSDEISGCGTSLGMIERPNAAHPGRPSASSYLALNHAASEWPIGPRTRSTSVRSQMA